MKVSGLKKTLGPYVVKKFRVACSGIENNITPVLLRSGQQKL